MNKMMTGFRKNALSLGGKLIFKARGWDFTPLPDYWEDRQVIIGFPHTTVLDTVMAFSGFAIVKQKGHVMVKKEAFLGPFSPILKGIGAIPVDRKSKNGIVQDMVNEFQNRESFQLSIVPEGTRGKTKRLKTGFWHIAKQAQVPIVCWYLDNQGQRTCWAGRVFPGESLEEDLEKIRRLYQAVGYTIPSTT